MEAEAGLGEHRQRGDEQAAQEGAAIVRADARVEPDAVVIVPWDRVAAQGAHDTLCLCPSHSHSCVEAAWAK